MSDSTLGDLLSWIDASPSPYHAAHNAFVDLVDAGFEAFSPDEDWDDSGRVVVSWGGVVIAAAFSPKMNPDQLRFRLVGAHTDSPNLRIKPKPDFDNVGYRQLGVEVYGGVLLNSWLDRDLGLSGRVVVRDGTTNQSLLFEANRPLLRVAQLAIHLDREVNEGLKLDRQSHLAPIWGVGASEAEDFRSFLAGEFGVNESDVLSWDVMCHDLTPATVLGQNNDLYAAPRIDNLASCHAALKALQEIETVEDNTIAVMVLFDHEEIGSESATGARGPMLTNALERLAGTVSTTREQFLRALNRSICVSADGAHAVHPNYVDRHEPQHRVVLNGGPVIKTNANVRYATDAESNAIFQSVCRSAGVPFQQYAHRTDLLCGSTIGPITAAQLGMSVVDVGSAQLSMHSAREMGGSEDPAYLTSALTEFLAGA
ncbi:MAG: M18 family aminopeptidase [Acidimicrobiales bacterium]|jgi:aspartyl aminopeptidase|nr:M18 family aminopeptidase [Acidimicrobiales bacterium]